MCGGFVFVLLLNALLSESYNHNDFASDCNFGEQEFANSTTSLPLRLVQKFPSERSRVHSCVIRLPPSSSGLVKPKEAVLRLKAKPYGVSEGTDYCKRSYS